jgi:hypothetical protein
LRLIDGETPSEGTLVRLKRTGEAGHIVHVFSVHPFKGDVVVLVGERRELCSVEEVDKIET